MSTSNDFHPAYFLVRFRTDGPVARCPEHFVIITAYATTGEEWSDARNTEADHQLHAHLVALGHTPIRVTGYDPESGHGEPGWAVDLPLEQARALGRQFLQDAIFRVQGDALSVGRCAPGSAWVEMGSFRERVDMQ